MKKTEEEKQNVIWEGLLTWLTGSESLPREIRNYFIEHAHDLRLKMQAVIVQMQTRNLHQIALDIELEEELRKNLRREVPYMSVTEKATVLHTLNSTNADKLKRLQEQLAGFDFLNTVQIAVQSVDENKASPELVDQVKKIDSLKRKQLLGMLNDIVNEVEKEEQTIDTKDDRS